MEGNSSSQPDLSKMGDRDLESKNISYRKRKVPDDSFSFQFIEFKKEILGILKDSAKSHNEKIDSINMNVSSIKDQLTEIKNTTQHLIAENANFKVQISSLTNSIDATNEKVKSLENDFQQIKSSTPTAPLAQKAIQTMCNDLIAELQEREERKKNIIIVGIPEPHCEDMSEKRKADREKVHEITSSIYAECPKSDKIIRLGKYDPNKMRPLKVCFASPDVTLSILKNKVNNKDETVKIYSDKTPYEQECMKNLRYELQEREKNGEKNLIIKYIKGIPKIIKSQPKN